MTAVLTRYENSLLKAIDRAAKAHGKTRTQFLREAAEEYVQKARVAELVRQDREGYRRKPIKSGEFGKWEKEQVWAEDDGWDK